MENLFGILGIGLSFYFIIWEAAKSGSEVF